jgi:hypothetical protein
MSVRTHEDIRRACPEDVGMNNLTHVLLAAIDRDYGLVSATTALARAHELADAERATIYIRDAINDAINDAIIARVKPAKA